MREGINPTLGQTDGVEVHLMTDEEIRKEMGEDPEKVLEDLKKAVGNKNEINEETSPSQLGVGLVKGDLEQTIGSESEKEAHKKLIMQRRKIKLMKEGGWKGQSKKRKSLFDVYPVIVG